MQKTSPAPLFNSQHRALRTARARKIADESADFLAEIAADIIVDRLRAITRDFKQALDFESLFDCMHDKLQHAATVSSIERLGGLSLRREITEIRGCTGAVIPVPTGKYDLITSILGLHWQNDLPGQLAQIRQGLQPDGLFMAALPGDRTLTELRTSLIEAETELTGNVSLRIDPFGEVKQYGSLLQRAGFALPVVDTELVTARYSSLSSLIKDLRAWSATRSLSATAGFASRQIFKRAEEIYFEKFGDADGKIRASFEIVFLLGWAPHHSQQKPLKPGSGQISLSEVLTPKDQD